MPSKLVADRQKSARSVLALSGTQVPTIVARLTELLTPYLQGDERLPDIELFVQLVLRLLDAACTRMMEADRANHAERDDDHAPRKERNRTVKALYHELTATRELLKGVFGRAAARALGFSGITPRDPVALSLFADHVLQALRERDLPPPKIPSITWDPSQILGRLTALHNQLDRLLEDLRAERIQAVETHLNKHRTIAEYDDRFGRAATFLEALFRLAGADDLAERVRPSRRRPGRTSPPRTKPAPAAAPRARRPRSKRGARPPGPGAG